MENYTTLFASLVVCILERERTSQLTETTVIWHKCRNNLAQVPNLQLFIESSIFSLSGYFATLKMENVFN